MGKWLRISSLFSHDGVISININLANIILLELHFTLEDQSLEDWSGLNINEQQQQLQKLFHYGLHNGLLFDLLLVNDQSCIIFNTLQYNYNKEKRISRIFVQMFTYV